MSFSAQAEIFKATNVPGVFERGWKSGQKGVDFERYWAIGRIIELANTDAPDFQGNLA
jgi:hypothetical protein